MEGSQRPFDQYAYLPFRVWGVSSVAARVQLEWQLGRDLAGCGAGSARRTAHGAAQTPHLTPASPAPHHPAGLRVRPHPSLLHLLLHRARRPGLRRRQRALRAAVVRGRHGLLPARCIVPPLPVALPEGASPPAAADACGPLCRHWVTGNSCTPPGTPDEFKEKAINECGPTAPCVCSPGVPAGCCKLGGLGGRPALG